MKPWIVHHLYCSVSLINLQYKMISCPGHKTELLSSESPAVFSTCKTKVDDSLVMRTVNASQ